MPSLVIKDLPADLHRQLKAQAEANHRSMTKEAIALLEAALSRAPGVRELPPPYRGKIKLTQEFIDKAKREARE